MGGALWGTGCHGTSGHLSWAGMEARAVEGTHPQATEPLQASSGRWQPWALCPPAETRSPSASAFASKRQLCSPGHLGFPVPLRPESEEQPHTRPGKGQTGNHPPSIFLAGTQQPCALRRLSSCPLRWWPQDPHRKRPPAVLRGPNIPFPPEGEWPGQPWDEPGFQQEWGLGRPWFCHPGGSPGVLCRTAPAWPPRLQSVSCARPGAAVCSGPRRH